MADFRHLSVMPEEVLRLLSPKRGGVYLDGTVGGGGHAELILRNSGPDSMLIGMDRDRRAIDAAGERLDPFGERVKLAQGNFANLEEVLDRLHVERLDGFLLDLGVSSHQLDAGQRGFSFMQDAPLDMRMDQSGGETAADLVNQLPEGELARIIHEYGEERWSKRVASFIVKARAERPIATTLELVDIIKGAIPKGAWEERIHPATRTFQALRIAVNRELESLEEGLKAAFGRLGSGGRGVVISFHSLEDRIVKNTFRSFAAGCRCPRDFPRCVCGREPAARVLTGKPVKPSEQEVARNPRARSARVRAVEKI